jgi:hypothetical protein
MTLLIPGLLREWSDILSSDLSNKTFPTFLISWPSRPRDVNSLSTLNDNSSVQFWTDGYHKDCKAMSRCDGICYLPLQKCAMLSGPGQLSEAPSAARVSDRICHSSRAFSSPPHPPQPPTLQSRREQFQLATKFNYSIALQLAESDSQLIETFRFSSHLLLTCFPALQF